MESIRMELTVEAVFCLFKAFSNLLRFTDIFVAQSGRGFGGGGGGGAQAIADMKETNVLRIGSIQKTQKIQLLVFLKFLNFLGFFGFL